MCIRDRFQHGVRGADARMAGEGPLAARAEDAQAIAAALIDRRQDEGRLRQACPARDRLHVVIGQAFGVQHHGEGIAGAGAVGEDIGLHVRTQAAGGFCH